MIWWEKTVEYKYILRYADMATFALPFDGNHEKLGDAIIGSDDKWTLIEFKRSVAQLDSEKAKFANYDSAKVKLKDRDSCHFLIYGEQVAGELELKAKRYFSRIAVSINDTKGTHAMDYVEFTKYLKELYQEKLKKESSTGSIEIGHVMGVERNGEASRMVSVVDYLRAVGETALANDISKWSKHTIKKPIPIKPGRR